jgi:IclR family transcriptional regulator, KDG regulon repressor
MMSGSREELAGARAVAVPALDRGMALLRVLGASSEPLTLAELSDAIGVSRSTVYSLLATLQRHGMVEKEPRHKTYRLGVAAFELGSAYLSGVSLLPIFNEVAQRLVNLCHETVKLAVLDGRDVVYLGKQEGLYTVRIVARVGSRMPAHATAVGKVLLAELSDTALAEQIAAVRAEGSAEDREESSIGLQCVAAPVRDHSRAVVAAVSIGVPNDRLNEQRLAELRQLLIEHAQDISRRLGWSE